MTKFGAQVSCYLTTWDDIRAVVETMEAGRWYSVYLRTTSCRRTGRA
jgi:hypothetical protein